MKKAKEQFCVTIQELETVKAKMKEFCNNKETIHVSFESKKIVILKDPAKIESAHNHFCIFKPIDAEFEETFTVQYIDIASGIVKIDEFPIELIDSKNDTL